MLGSSFDACETLDLAAQEVLFDVMVAPIRAKLNTMPPAASWAAASMNGFDGGMTTPDDDEDAFAYSMQPLPYITGVGENLLVTVHLLEPIATGEYQRTAQVLFGWCLPGIPPHTFASVVLCCGVCSWNGQVLRGLVEWIGQLCACC